MGLHYGGKEPGAVEKSANYGKLNKWADAHIPSSGSALNGEKYGVVHASGSHPVVVGPLTYGMLYEIISRNSCTIVSVSNPNPFSATFSSTFHSYKYQPADLPAFHIPESGSSEYVLIANIDESDVDATLSIVERSEGD